MRKLKRDKPRAPSDTLRRARKSALEFRLAERDEIVTELRRLGDPKNAAGMARYGINARQALGISAVPLRALARRIGKNHALAGRLWASGIFEAWILAAFIGEPAWLTRQQARVWARDFENWAD